jgi:sugar phosphate isomerase/epimerase
MNTIKGPAIFLAQFMDDTPPFNDIISICKWVSKLGYKGVQIPTWDSRCINLEKVAKSKDYADEYKEKINSCGVEITELSTHLQGQLVAVNPIYDKMFDGFAPKEYRKNPKKRTNWAINQLLLAAQASKNLGIKVHVTFSGALLWPYIYPWPQRPSGLVSAGFNELAKRWKPILECFDNNDIDLCYEIHPNEDLHDGVTFERFLKATGNHNRVNMLYDPSHFVLQQLDYLDHIDIYHDYIKMFHVKDAEFNPNGRAGVYGSYSDWIDRPGRFRSLGDGQVDFKSIFSKLTQYGYDGWAVLEWECCIKSPEQGAKEGSKFISNNIIEVTKKTFDDFADTGSNQDDLKNILGID